MEGQTKLHLIVLYNAPMNEYSLSAHNQTPEQAEQFVRELKPRLEPGSSLITLDQRAAHKTDEAQSCKTCRERSCRRRRAAHGEVSDCGDFL